MEDISTEAALALIATLPREQAEIVVLRVVVGLDAPQVARVVGKSPGAVRIAAHRGLRTLAARLGDVGTAPPAARELPVYRRVVAPDPGGVTL